MINLKFTIILMFFFNLCLSQSKEETISYLNSILKLKSNYVEYYSFVDNGEGDLVVYNKTYIGSDGSYLYFKFNPTDALYVNNSTNSRGQMDILLSFKKGTVKLLFNIDGETRENLSDINLAPLVNMSKGDVEKFIKAYKHMIKLYGGLIKEDPFK